MPKAAPPPPPPPPVNAVVQKVILTATGGILVLFDIPVIVSTTAPPTTWSFGPVTEFLTGDFNIGTVSYLTPDGTVSIGDTAVIGDEDPAARTPDGGYVTGTTMVITGS